jgi:glutaredoxin
MTAEITIYSRKGCCLCEEMKAVVGQIAKYYPLRIREIDVDTSSELQDRFGSEVPVLLINGRKAFKYRVTAKDLQKKLRQVISDGDDRTV